MKFLCSDKNPSYQNLSKKFQSIQSNTALIHAVESGNKEIVEYLLDNDADITLEDDEGRDAIAYARIYDDNEQILDLLREHSDRYVNRYDSGENYYEGKYIDERRSPKRNRNRDGEIIYEY